MIVSQEFNDTPQRAREDALLVEFGLGGHIITPDEIDFGLDDIDPVNLGGATRTVRGFSLTEGEDILIGGTIDS
jgi:hypothetical protein